MPNALASDIDYTLYFPDKSPSISLDDQKAIAHYQQEGHLFGLCSGRPYSGIVNLFETIHPDFYIISSGAIILDKSLHPIYEKHMSYHTIQNIFHQYQNQALIIIHTKKDVYKTQKEFSADSCIIFHSVEQIKEIIYGISLVFHNETQAYQETQNINHMYKDVFAFQNLDSIDIVSKGCSKGEAIKRVRDNFHIKTFAGIGDSYNDLPMLKCVDIPITLNTSPQPLKDISQLHVESVTQAIKELL